MLGEGRAAEIDQEFKKAVAERLEPYWKDIQAYEHGSFWARLRVQIKYTLLLLICLGHQILHQPITLRLYKIGV